MQIVKYRPSSNSPGFRFTESTVRFGGQELGHRKSLFNFTN